MKNLLLLALAFIFLVASCRKEDQPEPQQGRPPIRPAICQICIHKDTVNDPNTPHYHGVE